MPPLVPSFNFNRKYIIYGGGGLLALLVILMIYASFAGSGTQEAAGPTFDESFEFVPSAVFTCLDKTTFRTEFPDNDRVQIIVDGSVLRQVPRAYAPLGIRYEDTGWIYAFQGPELVVTRKSDYTSTTCTQVVAPGKAPLDFGS